jgi:hypothetical protein
MYTGNLYIPQKILNASISNQIFSAHGLTGMANIAAKQKTNKDDAIGVVLLHIMSSPGKQYGH